MQKGIASSNKTKNWKLHPIHIPFLSYWGNRTLKKLYSIIYQSFCSSHSTFSLQKYTVVIQMAYDFDIFIDIAWISHQEIMVPISIHLPSIMRKYIFFRAFKFQLDGKYKKVSWVTFWNQILIHKIVKKKKRYEIFNFLLQIKLLFIIEIRKK